MLGSALKGLAGNADTRTTIAGVMAAAVLAKQGLNLERLIEGDLTQVALVIAALLVAVIGRLATHRNADGKTTILGVVAGALMAASGEMASVTTGVVIAVLGYYTNKGPGVPELEPPAKDGPGR